MPGRLPGWGDEAFAAEDLEEFALGAVDLD
jgi:hypothetical protein